MEPPTKAETAFRHTGWHGRRRLIWDALTRLHHSDMTRYRFANCGSGCWVQHSPIRGKFRLSCNTCKSRWCSACGKERAAKIMRSLAPRLSLETTRFITLTRAHDDKPLRQQIDELYKWFNELRRSLIWKSAITGAAAFLEVKIGKDKRWHPHLHVLANGAWIDQRDLRREWKRISKTSHIVDVRKPKSLKEVRFYVTKYITKPLDNSIVSTPDRLDEAITALKGRRVCNASGDFGAIIAAKPPDDLPDDWITMDRFDVLQKDAANGDELAQIILESVTFKLDTTRHRKGDSS